WPERYHPRQAGEGQHRPGPRMLVSWPERYHLAALDDQDLLEPGNRPISELLLESGQIHGTIFEIEHHTIGLVLEYLALYSRCDVPRLVVRWCVVVEVLAINEVVWLLAV